ncbi:MAG TPA: CheR family methyltransferase [Candidatus Methanoperedens sp.]|nr:CheR family methyltransferase [Candidatus Methanoperedens sp.]
MARTAVEVAEADFLAVRDFVTHRAGLYFAENKRGELLAAVRERATASIGSDSVAEYLALLEGSGDGGRELRRLVARLTVGETYFFRNRSQFDLLRERILPDLIQRRRGARRRLRLWSAGCSSGEEPYSLAILLLELLPDIASWDVHLLATDINEEALEAAREGRYRAWSFRDVEEHYRKRFFTREADGWRIVAEVQRLVNFRALNLATDPYPSLGNGTDALDVILCRNVMIYFRPELCREITRRFFACLREHGSLIVGHSEHSDLVDPEFARVFHGRAIVYRKPGQEPALAKGLAIRFRGEGPPPAGTPGRVAPRRPTGGTQRPAVTEETVLFEEAVALVAQRRAAAAIEAFRRVLEVNPRNERALYSSARLLADAGVAAEAGAFAERVLALNPLHLEATYLLALLARGAGDAARELSFLRRALYLDPGFVLGHFQTGLHHARAGNGRQARRSLHNALRLLDGLADAGPVAGVEDMTVGRLREAILALLPGGARGEETR